ncbi:MAG: DUF4231 domain-containing protein [Aggregatilineales bacterium]
MDKAKIQTFPETTRPRSPGDSALRVAWQRYLEYSYAANRRKRTHVRVRRGVILLSLVSTVLAVTITYRDVVPLIGAVADGIRLVLIILPLVIAGILAFSLQFMPSMAWIAYRIGAEMIRRQIYLYRMNAGEYIDKPSFDQQELLIQRIGEADTRVDEIGSPEPYIMPNFEDLEAEVRKKVDRPEIDDGFSAMSVEQYIEGRVIPQREWYINKLHHDYRSLRRWRAMVLFFAGLGSFLVVIGLEPLVAITTAFGVAIGLYIDLQLYGRTYGIYHLTARRLEQEMARWSVLPAEQKDENAEQAAFVQRIEDIFQEERDVWMQQALQAQSATEQGIMRNVNLANTPFNLGGAGDERRAQAARAGQRSAEGRPVGMQAMRLTGQAHAAPRRTTSEIASAALPLPGSNAGAMNTPDAPPDDDSAIPPGRASG